MQMLVVVAVWRGCPLAPRSFFAAVGTEHLSGQALVLLGCTGTSLQKQSRYWHNWAACGAWVNVGVDCAAPVV